MWYFSMKFMLNYFMTNDTKIYFKIYFNSSEFLRLFEPIYNSDDPTIWDTNFVFKHIDNDSEKNNILITKLFKLIYRTKRSIFILRQ